MGLFWAGIAETLVAAGIGTWLYLTLPTTDAIWGEALWAAAFISLVATLILGRDRGDATAPEAAEPIPDSPVTSPETPALPPPAPLAADPPATPLMEPLLPERVTTLQAEVVKSRWEWQARHWRLQLNDLEHAAPRDGADPARHRRKLTDAAILSQGFGRLAMWKPPTFDLAPYRRTWTAPLVAARLRELESEEADLKDLVARWAPDAGPTDGSQSRSHAPATTSWPRSKPGLNRSPSWRWAIGNCSG
jgi:hypothetical protein